jgi:hypothetical protein
MGDGWGTKSVKQGAWGKSFKNHRRAAENAKITDRQTKEFISP